MHDISEHSDACIECGLSRSDAEVVRCVPSTDDAPETIGRDIDAALETASSCRLEASRLKQCGTQFVTLAKWHLDNAKAAERWAVKRSAESHG